MHYLAEIIIPPTERDIEQVVAEILDGFQEEIKDEDTGEWVSNSVGFYDWYVIGGRFSGEKLTTQLEKEKLEAFYKELQEKEFTVSGVIAGKEKLMPESQIPEVDAIWRKHFPDSGLNACPFFDHFDGGQYKDKPYWPDVMTVYDCPKDLKAATVIVAKPHWDEENHPDEFVAGYIMQREYWNGVNFQDTDWDGSVGAVIEKINGLDYPKIEIGDNWLVVTVDYHS